MSTNIDSIIIVNEQELITSSIDGYFRNIALIAEFADGDLVAGKTFPVAGYAEFTTLAGVAEYFPTTHQVYKDAQKILAQKANTGVNKSSLEKLVVVQIKATDTNIESGLTRVGYADAYHWVLVSKDAEDIESASNYFLDKRKILHAQTSDADVLTDTTGNIAETLVDGGLTRTALYYHSIDTESLAGAVASILCNANAGSTAGFYRKPSGITVDVLSDTQKGKLDGNHVNYYTPFIGQAGSYMTRNLTANGVMISGQKIQKIIQLDRIILSLQSAGMDALEMDIPYTDFGGGVLGEKLGAVLLQLQNETIIAPDSTDDNGDVLEGYSSNVLTIAETKRSYPSLYSTQTFKTKAIVTLALSAEKVEIDLAY